MVRHSMARRGTLHAPIKPWGTESTTLHRNAGQGAAELTQNKKTRPVLTATLLTTTPPPRTGRLSPRILRNKIKKENDDLFLHFKLKIPLNHQNHSK